MPRKVYRLLWRTVEECVKDNTAMLAAGLSFYTLLSMAPAFWVTLAVAGSIAGREAVREQILGWARTNVGERGAEYLATVVNQVDDSSRLVTAVGLLSMFFGATLVFGALHDSLNRIWAHQSAPDRSILKGFFIKRLLAFLVVLFVGALIVASLLIHAAVRAVARFAPTFLPVPPALLNAIDFVVSTAIILLLFAGIYRFLHARKRDWHEVWVGASVTAVLFAIGKTLIGMYLGSAAVTSAYGVAGSLVVLLLWVYYSAQIFLFGAEFTEVYANEFMENRKKLPVETT